MFKDRQIIDISRKMVPEEVNNTFGVKRELASEPIIFKMAGLDDSRMSVVTIHSHIGTHIEMPVHLFPDKMDISECPMEKFICEVRLADVTFAGELAELTVADIERATDGDVRAGDAVIVYSEFAPEKRPVITLEVVDWLLDQGMGVLGFDSMAGITNDAHTKALGSDIPLLEEVVNLDQVPASRGTLIALPMSVEGLDSFPVRALIVV